MVRRFISFFIYLIKFFIFLVIDTTYEWKPLSPIPIRAPTIDDNTMIIFETTKEETVGYDAEEQTHNLIGEIIRKRTRNASINQGHISTESYCDPDRVSLLSVDINLSTSNLNLETSDTKI